MYRVKSIQYTLQGEGHHLGRPAVFVRFAGCNLWSGREKDRSTARCQFCDTDFRGVDGPGGGLYMNALAVGEAIAEKWPDSPHGDPCVVFTGGEPLLQLDEGLVEEVGSVRGFFVAVETNGTLPVPAGVDWLTVSPKAGAALVLEQGDELKVVFPQEGLDLPALADLEFDYRYLSPLNGPNYDANLRLAAAYCQENPEWYLTLQMNKMVSLP